MCGIFGQVAAENVIKADLIYYEKDYKNILCTQLS
jgi:hypothetical protein